jgi:hypothetical protein
LLGNFQRDLNYCFSQNDAVFVGICRKFILRPGLQKLMVEYKIEANHSEYNNIKRRIPSQREISEGTQKLREIIGVVNLRCFDILIDIFCKNRDFETLVELLCKKVDFVYKVLEQKRKLAADPQHKLLNSTKSTLNVSGTDQDHYEARMWKDELDT